LLSKLLIIIPAHNEASNIPAVINDLRQHLSYGDIVVIDDASTDNTAEIVNG